MSDNPFAEPDDTDRTIIRPAPGGRRPAPEAAPSAARPAPQAPDLPPPSAEAAEGVATGISPLAEAAGPLLQLLARLRNMARQPDPGELRERAIRELRAFEERARAQGVPAEQLRPAHYALCASLDDVVLNTPWGSQGPWAARSLVSTFHQEVRSGERFFDLLAQLRQHPGKFLPVLELMYLCLSLGFMGRYRLSPRGPGELDKLREDLYALIMRQRPAAEPALSPHWQGVAAPYRPSRPVLPVWVAGAGAAAILAGLFVWFSFGLAGSSDAVFDRMAQAPLATLPTITRSAPVVPPVEPVAAMDMGALGKLHTFLAPEIREGLVEVLGTPVTPIVRIKAAGMFGSGSAGLQRSFVPLLERIGRALDAERGSVEVLGYTDNQPIRTVRFPSNYQLSAARAQAARAVIARELRDPGRVTAEGRGDADPIASNATPQGREENRRIEVVLHGETQA